MTQQQPAQENLWEMIREYIADRESAAKSISRLAKSLEYILCAEFEAEATVVVLRFADEYETLYRAAHGDHRDNEMQSDRERAKGTLPTARSGRSDPTAEQAEASAKLAKVDERLREMAERHRIRQPGDPPGEQPKCKACASPHSDSIAQMFAAGWTLDQIASEVASFGKLKGAFSTAISRATLGRHRRHLDGPTSHEESA